MDKMLPVNEFSFSFEIKRKEERKKNCQKGENECLLIRPRCFVCGTFKAISPQGEKFCKRAEKKTRRKNLAGTGN